jgi:hypothetical protein
MRCRPQDASPETANERHRRAPARSTEVSLSTKRGSVAQRMRADGVAFSLDRWYTYIYQNGLGVNLALTVISYVFILFIQRFDCAHCYRTDYRIEYIIN